MEPCVFCRRVETGDVLCANTLAAAFTDGFPVTPGHTLIIPRRHEPDFLALSLEETHAIWDLVAEVRSAIEADAAPTGYNIGVNAGASAGQTIRHAHLHVIPRFDGDVEDPRGGVRWVIPARAAYWRD